MERSAGATARCRTGETHRPLPVPKEEDGVSVKRVRSSRKALRAVAGTLIILAVLAVLLAAARIWTDYLWYQSLGQESVFTTQIIAQGLVWLGATAVAFVLLCVSALAARRIVGVSALSTALAFGGPALFAVLSGWNMSKQWMVFRMAVSQPSFGITEPQFGKDVAFFVFRLPALELLGGWFTDLIILSFLLVLGVIFLPVWSGLTETMEDHWWQLKSVIMRLFGLLILSAGFNFMVSVWGLALSTRTAQTGASYADVHAQLPANWIVTGASVLLAVVLFTTARSKKWVVPISAFAVWVAIVVVVGNVWPAIVQNYVVSPNEPTLEAPYIERNISMTRTAFDLASVDEKSYAVIPSWEGTTTAGVNEVLDNARLWTPDSVEQAYEQLQTIRPYYTLSDIQIDRYQVNGRQREVLVSARQIDMAGLPKRARTWVNEHLVYTHGCGLVISSVSASSEKGFPVFLVGDVLPKVADDVAPGSPTLVTTQPRIYYGTNVSDYAIVNTGIDEFDYPLGAENITYRYEYDQGVEVGPLVQRLAWAVSLNSDQLLFSEYITPESRVLLHRNVKERAQKIAPWLEFAEKPYPALVEGRIVWILDAYTSTDHFPYSQRTSGGVNYMRNSVKVVVDAYTGDATFYAWGDDPIRDAWSEIFPTVLTSAGEVPDSLAAHFRYPKTLFAAQAEIYRTYHMADPTVFYNKEDQWQQFGEGDEIFGASYLTLEMPDAVEGSGLYLMQPYAPVNRDNMISLLAAACDPEEYGNRTVYMLPKGRVILGPDQVVAQINQDPTISPQLSLWDQRGSSVIFGDMLVLPLEGTIIYVQPVFLQAEDAAITELVGVVVVNGERVEMGSTLAEALARTDVSGTSR